MFLKSKMIMMFIFATVVFQCLAQTPTEKELQKNGFNTIQNQKSQKISISVMPITGDSTIKDLLTVFSDIFRQELASTGNYEVMAREIMEEIMKEQQLQLSGICDESSCMVEAGKIIGVSYIASAKIVKTGKSSFVVTVKIVDVSTGAIVKQGNDNRDGDTYTVIKEMLRDLAKKMIPEITANPVTGYNSDAISKVNQMVVVSDKKQNEKNDYVELVQNDSANKKIMISVLPLQADSSLKDLLPVMAVFTDVFRKNLTETGLFNVMAREMMDQLIEEREFQLSDMCDQPTCMAAAGKIFGVSQIAAGSIARSGKETYVIAVKLVDVATGSIIRQENQKASGDAYTTIGGMLKDLASFLAGQITEDHTESKKQEDIDIKENYQQNRIQSKRFSISVHGDGLYPVHLLKKDNYSTVRNYLNTSPKASKFKDPSDGFGIGGIVDFAYQFNSTFSLMMEGGFFSPPSEQKEAVTSYDYDKISVIAGTTDTVHFSGPVDGYSKSIHSYKFGIIGIGTSIKVVKSPRVQVSIDALPIYGYMKYTVHSLDSSLWNLPSYLNNNYQGHVQIYDEAIKKAMLHGSLFGGRAGVSVKFFPKHWFGLQVSSSLQTLIAPALEGVQTTQTVGFKNINNKIENSYDTTYTESAAMMSGDWLGTGEYISVQNPDVPYKNPETNEPIATQKTWTEFSAIRFSFGIVFLF